jgi:hypothetical protein
MNTPNHISFREKQYHSTQKQPQQKYAVYKRTFSMEKQKENSGWRCKEKMMITKIRRDAKALSPIFAVLILIAISVIAGIVVYMFTSGTIATMTGGGTAGQEKVAVEAVQYSTGAVSVWAKSVGGGAVIIDSIIVKDSSGLIVASGVITTLTGTTTLPATGALTQLGGSVTLVAGNTYTVTLTSANGGSFNSASFKA